MVFADHMRGVQSVVGRRPVVWTPMDSVRRTGGLVSRRVVILPMIQPVRERPALVQVRVDEARRRLLRLGWGLCVAARRRYRGAFGDLDARQGRGGDRVACAGCGWGGECVSMGKVRARRGRARRRSDGRGVRGVFRSHCG